MCYLATIQDELNEETPLLFEELSLLQQSTVQNPQVCSYRVM